MSDESVTELRKRLKIRENDYRYKGRTRVPIKAKLQWRKEAIHYLKMASERVAESGKLMQQTLVYAREAGEYLLAAKARVKGKGGGWTRIVKDHFNGSVQTAQVYMRVAKKWDDPRMVEMRRRGMQPDSIEGFLGVLRNKRPPKEEEETSTPKEERKRKKSQDRSLLREKFGDWLIDFDLYELNVLEYYFDDLLQEMKERLQHRVCVTLEADYYHDPEWVRWRYHKEEISITQRIELPEEWKEMEEEKQQLRSKSAKKKPQP